MNHIKLVGTQVESYYRGCGEAFLVVENGKPTKLIYENPEMPAVRKDLNDDELMDLFAEHGVDFYELERKEAVILMGTCSCYDFCFPELFIDFKASDQG
ncbi:hypothetical protein C3744_27765 [Priestia megaterium]|uniref:Uncharacterized protein n=1 Tax=Priestia megaterium TaxID=1404 RepID=A0A3D8WUJ7_PRIMG|nr:hypothetical protein [Priestia megaterium]MDH3173333.1 hypothetical protein [Priestia megaterium]RDZ07204.1 hypothetical protein C3744_27765 [Priestia megaterium]